MQISGKRLNRTIEKQVFQIFFQLMADCKSLEEVETLLEDLLTKTELLVIAKRLAIALYLEKGRSYDNIKSTLKVSSATIASVQELMGNPGLQMALNKIKADEWADAWAGRISGAVARIWKKWWPGWSNNFF